MVRHAGWQGVILAAVLAGGGCSTVRAVANPSAIALDGKAVKQDEDGVLSYRVGTTVAAPVDRVWALLTDVAGYTAWNSTVVSFKGDLVKGGTVHLVSKLDPSRTFDLTVAELVPQQRLVWEDGMPMGLFSGVRTYEVSALPDGKTRFVMYEVFSGPMLRMIRGSLPDMAPSFETIAADLRRAAEAGNAAPGAAPAPAAATAPAAAPAPAPTP